MRHPLTLALLLASLALAASGCAATTSTAGARTRPSLAVETAPGLASGAPPAVACDKACPLPGWYAGVRASYGPDLGGAVEAGRVVMRTSCVEGAVEVRATYLFLDNTQALDLQRDAAATGWRQIEAGVKATFAPGAARHLTARAGLSTADVHGNLNVVRETGRYYGVYVGLGFETDFGERFTMGPSVLLHVMRHEEGGRVEFVPNVGWHATWEF